MKHVSNRDTSGPGKRFYYITAIIILVLAAFVSISSAADDLTSADADPVLLSVHALYDDFSSKHPDIPDISVEEFLALKERSDVVLLDNRTPEERAVSMIPGAMLDEEFEVVREEYEDAPIVVYCTIGVRSGRYTKKLLRWGFDAYNLAGGVLAWAHAEGEFVDSRGNRTDTVHVYGVKWNLLPSGYSPVW